MVCRERRLETRGHKASILWENWKMFEAKAPIKLLISPVSSAQCMHDVHYPHLIFHWPKWYIKEWMLHLLRNHFMAVGETFSPISVIWMRLWKSFRARHLPLFDMLYVVCIVGLNGTMPWPGRIMCGGLCVATLVIMPYPNSKWRPLTARSSLRHYHFHSAILD